MTRPVAGPSASWCSGFLARSRDRGMVMNRFDVRIHAIRRRRDRRRPFEVRWHAAGRDRSRSFLTRGLADSYRPNWSGPPARARVRSRYRRTGRVAGAGPPGGDVAGAHRRVCGGEMAAPGPALAGQPRGRPRHHHSRPGQACHRAAVAAAPARRPVPARLPGPLPPRSAASTPSCTPSQKSQGSAMPPPSGSARRRHLGAAAGGTPAPSPVPLLLDRLPGDRRRLSAGEEPAARRGDQRQPG
jgi:hypothetical protein